MSAPASKVRGTSPTAPGGPLAPTQTAQAVASGDVAGGAGGVEQGLAPSADGLTVPTVFGGHLLPLVLLVLLWSVFVGATCWGLGFKHSWDRAYPLGVEEGARAVTIEAYQEGRKAGQDEGYRTGLWDCWIESGRVL